MCIVCDEFRYTEREVTQAELNSLPPRAQDSINRFRDTAMRHGAQWGPGAYFNQPPAPGMTRRVGMLLGPQFHARPLANRRLRRLVD